MESKSYSVPAGGQQAVPRLPAGTSIGVAPGSGGTMNVQYRLSPNGPLKAWASGSVSAPTDEVLDGPVFSIVFTAVTAEGIAEVCQP